MSGGRGDGGAGTSLGLELDFSHDSEHGGDSDGMGRRRHESLFAAVVVIIPFQAVV